MSEFIATTSSGCGADEAGQRLGQQLVVREPRPVSLEVPLDAEALPGGELGVQLVAVALRLQTERVAGEVGDLGSDPPAAGGTWNRSRWPGSSTSRRRASCSSVVTERCPPRSSRRP